MAWAFLAAAVFFAACDPTGDRGEYADNLRKWQATRPMGYEYLYRRDCRCPLANIGPFIVSAAADSVLRVRRITPGADTVEVGLDLQGYSMQNIFADLKTNLDRRASYEYVHYNGDYGFPDSAFFDFDAQGSNDQYGFSVEMLRVAAKGNLRVTE